MHWLEQHWYRITPVSLLLWPVSSLYVLMLTLRRLAYRFGFLNTIILPIKVIVVGNMTVGGSGKTPLVIWLARYLRERGLHPGIVLRGYGGSTADWPHRVTAQHDPDAVGDEAVLLAREDICPVVVDPDRARGGFFLLKELKCNIIVSDDGLQHLRMHRDIEIAVIDGERRFGNNFCLPAGPLREPASRLRDIPIRITNGAPLPGELEMRLEATGFYRVNAPDISLPIDSFQGQSVHAVAGIGNPSRFFSHLRRLGIRIIEHEYPDHHRFKTRDIEFNDGLPIIMTQKDAVKCDRFVDNNAWYLAVEAKPDSRIGDEIWRRIKEKQHG
jgi:tetraacyldisaccharide 4'-kinase